LARGWSGATPSQQAPAERGLLGLHAPHAPQHLAVVGPRGVGREDRLLTVPEVAKRLHVDPKTVRRMLRCGQLRGSMQVSPRAGWRIPESAIRELIDRPGRQA
jgi:excisionase family DNA binding protein